MQALRMLHRSFTLVEKGACSVTSQLPELTRWHANLVSNFAARNAIRAGHVPSRAFAAMPLSTGKERVVVLGTGWAAARLALDIDCKHFDITVVSPRNHMVFTPLLTSACVGTLEFRSVAVPVMSLQKHLKEPQNSYLLASAQNVDPEKKVVQCEAEDGIEFSVSYDKLVIATGSQTESYCTKVQGSTFGIPGVEKYAYPLRDIAHANAIRNKLIANWSLANTPNRTAMERERMLSILVVGGGPTGVEFAGELSDFINKDLRKLDNGRASEMKVTLIEAQQLLGTFDAPLREYAANKLNKQGVHLLKLKWYPDPLIVRPVGMRPLQGITESFSNPNLISLVGQLPKPPLLLYPFLAGTLPSKAMKGMVKELTETEAHISTGEVLPYGMAVWSTGVGPTSFTTSLPFAKTARGRIAIDGEMRVLQHIDPEKTGKSDPSKPSDVKMHVEEHDTGHGKEMYTQVDSCYALGDCCANMELPLPALAQVAEQQGKYLARTFNALAKDPNTKIEPFSYKHMGSMASIGGNKALIQLGEQGKKHWSMKGFKSFLAWRSAYLTRLSNAQNRLYVVMNWLTTTIFGRDMSRW